MIKAIKLSKQENNIAKAKMHMQKFGRATLMSKDIISFNGESFDKAIGEVLYLSDGPNMFSILPEGSYSLADNTLFNVTADGKLSKITQKGSGTSTTVDPENQKQLWSKTRKETAFDRNVVKDNGAPKASQLSRHREFVLYKFGNATIYGGQKIKFPTDSPKVGTSPLFEDSTPMPDGIYQVTDPAGSLTVKNGFVSVWSPATATASQDEVKLNNHTEKELPKTVLSMTYTFADPSGKSKDEYFEEVDELDLPERAKEALKQKFLQNKK